ncbi:hypothetical protein N7504_006281 [Penicillium tannophilum]|nr:hypothetical protein N7504_006281 [Penicillium tannophilum]
MPIVPLIVLAIVLVHISIISQVLIANIIRTLLSALYIVNLFSRALYVGVSRPSVEDILYFTSPSAAIYSITLKEVIPMDYRIFDVTTATISSQDGYLASALFKIAGYARTTHSLLRGGSQIEYLVLGELVRTVLASVIFFFKFNITPVPSKIGFYYKGSILYLRLGASEILARVLVKIPSNYSLGNIDPKDHYKPYGYYRKRVAFYITSLKECFTINIANSVYYKKISGFLKLLNATLATREILLLYL